MNYVCDGGNNLFGLLEEQLGSHTLLDIALDTFPASRPSSKKLVQYLAGVGLVMYEGIEAKNSRWSLLLIKLNS